MDKMGYINQACDYLKQAGVKHAVYVGVESEPTDIYVAEALDLFEKENCDVVISLGGGSCIDTAKAIAVLVSNGGYIGDYTGGAKIADRKSTRLNSSHVAISYAVFCLKKKKNKHNM